MNDPVQTDALAAEYVLGTLDFDERTQAQALLVIDPEFIAKVRLWERWLGELHLMVEPVEPEGKVWDRIKAKVPAAPPKPESRIPAPRAQAPVSAPAAAQAPSPQAPSPQAPSPDAVPVAATEPTPAVTPSAAPAQFSGLPRRQICRRQACRRQACRPQARRRQASRRQVRCQVRCQVRSKARSQVRSQVRCRAPK